jgi:hypothetical protein
VKLLTRRIKRHGHNLYMDNFLSSPDLCNNLAKHTINWCRTVTPNRKGMPDDLSSKTLKLKWADVRVSTSGDMTTMI